MKRFSFILFSSLSFHLIIGQPNEKAQLANEYYQQGQYEKARELYDDLSDKKNSIPIIHSNYFELLLVEKDFKTAEKYLKQVLKLYPGNLQYESNVVALYQASGQKSEKEDYIKHLLEAYQQSQFQLNLIAQNLVSQQLLDDAILFIKEARKVSGNPYAFSLDMAGIYRIKNDKQSMTNEYINYAKENPLNINYVKNIFQNILKEDDDLDFLEQSLIKKIQSEPNNYLYSDLLIWVELQRKNFYGAFVQARSLDKKRNSQGDECMRIGQIAMDNEAWDDAIQIFEYVSEAFRDSYNYAISKRYTIRAKESKIKNTFPVNKAEIRNLIADYDNLIKEIGMNHISLEAQRNKALLHAFYLDENDSAIFILQNVINNPRSSPFLISRAKIDLGDIYLLNGVPWESTLLYSQVEKSNKESPIGYEAKLRNAKLNYYTGNFSLAQSHLDILKLATTREISNDAIDLSLLIKNNTVFDSSEKIMQQFANIELMIFQNKIDKSITTLIQLIKQNPSHPIVDEAYWQLASLYKQKGQFENAIGYLNKILELFPQDILADDAMYEKGLIYQDHLKNDDLAIQTFQDFLISHPGSLYAAEARKRIRKIRGDLIN
ncbi:MAG: tetratricopeptide repeat protein [Bacteroidota bacterium]